MPLALHSSNLGATGAGSISYGGVQLGVMLMKLLMVWPGESALWPSWCVCRSQFVDFLEMFVIPKVFGSQGLDLGCAKEIYNLEISGISGFWHNGSYALTFGVLSCDCYSWNVETAPKHAKPFARWSRSLPWCRCCGAAASVYRTAYGC